MQGLIATKKRLNSGFSLLEMAIVVTIVGIMLYTTLGISTAQTDIIRTRDTQNKLKRIDEALTVFFNTNGYLPCPADGSKSPTDSGFAKEEPTVANHLGANSTSATGVGCSNVNNTGGSHPSAYIGIVPTRTLGISDDYAFDAWGNRTTYAVSRFCVSATNWQSRNESHVNLYKCNEDGDETGAASMPNTTDGGRIVIQDSTGTWTTSAPWPVYITVSHGKNGAGAWRRNGGSTNPASASAQEVQNSDRNNLQFVDMPINDGSGGNYFDDIVRWRTGVQVYYDADY